MTDEEALGKLGMIITQNELALLLKVVLFDEKGGVIERYITIGR